MSDSAHVAPGAYGGGWHHEALATAPSPQKQPRVHTPPAAAPSASTAKPAAAAAAAASAPQQLSVPNSSGSAARSSGAPGSRLSAEQQGVVDLLLAGRNVFLTGPGGTGKSEVIKEAKRQLEAAGKRVALTATTGVAAVNVGGTTLHAFLKMRAEDNPGSSRLLRYIRSARYNAAYDLIRSLSVLIVDEVSMMPPLLLYQADALLRAVRGRPDVPFGGLTVLLVGDFHQLPPVRSKGSKSIPLPAAVTSPHAEVPAPQHPHHGHQDRARLRSSRAAAAAAAASDRGADFIFQTRLFYELVDDVVSLRRSFRHGEISSLSRLLLDVRRGIVRDWQEAVLRQRLNATLPTQDGIEPTIMYSRNADVDRINAERLAALPGEAVSFSARAGVEVDASLRRALLALRKRAKAAAAPPAARSSNTRNLMIPGPSASATAAAAAAAQAEVEAAAAALPVKSLTEARTVLMDALRARSAEGQDRAAKSGAAATASGAAAAAGAASSGGGRFMRGLQLKVGAQVMLSVNLDVDAGLVNGTRGVVIGFREQTAPHAAAADGEGAGKAGEAGKLRKGRNKPTGKKGRGKGPLALSAEDAAAAAEDGGGSGGKVLLPYVRFGPDGTARFITVPWQRMSWRIDGVGTVWTESIPLKLAWATTIHKSQGATLDRVELAIDRFVFEEGQAYVALSRVRTLEGLRLTAFRKDKVFAHSAVLDFYRNAVGDEEEAQEPHPAPPPAAAAQQPAVVPAAVQSERYAAYRQQQLEALPRFSLEDAHSG